MDFVKQNKNGPNRLCVSFCLIQSSAGRENKSWGEQLCARRSKPHACTFVPPHRRFIVTFILTTTEPDALYEHELWYLQTTCSSNEVCLQ